MVAPQTSGRLRGARNVELIGVGHNALLSDQRVRALVAAELERVARDARASGRSRNRRVAVGSRYVSRPTSEFPG